MRQYGNFSFSRVYQASGAVAASQPETAYRIFQRAIFGLDIATGTTNTETISNNSYSSKGTPTTPQAKQEAPTQPEPTCYVLDPVTCSDRAWGEVYYSTGVIHQHILIDQATAHLFPEISSKGKNQTAGKIEEGKDGDDHMGRGRRLNEEGFSASASASASAAAAESSTTSKVPTNSGTSTKLLRNSFVVVGASCCWVMLGVL